MKTKTLLVAITAAAALPLVGNAAIVTDSAGFTTTPPSGTTASLLKYDGLSGTLVKVTLSITGTISGLFDATNNDPGSNTVTLDWNPATTAADSGLGGSPYLSPSGGGNVSDSATLGGFGTTNFGGTKSLAYSGSAATTAAGALTDFTGAGSFSVDISNVIPWTITGTASATGNASSFANEGTVTVTYETIPEPQTYALLAGLGMLGFVAVRRRFRA